MIGGNGYGDDPLDESTIPSREMYIRWLQANVFMPGKRLFAFGIIFNDHLNNFFP